MNRYENLKRQLCAGIDDLAENQGFVLIATEDQIVFTPLRSYGGYDGDSSIEIEQLTQAEIRLETTKLRNGVASLERTKRALEQDIATAETRLADLNAAIANALGRKAA